MSGLDLLVLGDCNPDLVLSGDVEPDFGQVEKIVDDARLLIGGSGAITACGAARLGLRTALAAVVGDDSFGRFLREALVARDVDISGVIVDTERPTGLSVVLARGQKRAILTALGTIERLSADDVDRSALRSARHVHISSFFLQHRLRAGLRDLLDEARKAGAFTSVDPNWDPSGGWDGGLLDVLATTHALLCNAEEVRRITGLEDVEAAAQVLGRRGPLVVVKLGGDGALACVDGRIVRVAAPPAEVVDTVGAGDSFDAGFLAGRLAGRSLEESLALAVSCGSLSTRATGGTTAQPTLEEATTA